jgi:hypothetical protein
LPGGAVRSSVVVLECSCPCCTFEQRIELKEFKGAKKELSTLKEPEPFGWTLDCFWFKKGAQRKRFSSQEANPGEGYELICAGRTGKSEDGAGEVAEQWLDSECRYKFKDTSSWQVKDEKDFSLTVNWEGRIWDRCRRTVRRVKTFGVVFSSGKDGVKAQVTTGGKTTDAKKVENMKKGEGWKWDNPDEECK